MPVRLTTERTAPTAPQRARPSVLTDQLLVATARTLSMQLPLRTAPAPYHDRTRGDWAESRRTLEHAVAERAVASGLAIDVGETTEQLAARLARSGAIAPPAADAIAALAPVLRRGEAGCADDSLAVLAARVAERLAGTVRSAGRR
jgi:hypothetical protein